MKGKAICIGCAAALTLCTVIPFYTFTVSADDPATRYQISASSWADFYDTIPASVLGQDGQYHDVDFLFQGQYAGITSSGLCYYPDGQAFNTSTYPMVWYSCPYPIYNDSQNNALWEVEKVILHLNLHLSSCDFVRFGFCGATSSINGFYNLNYYAVDHYNYADYYINTLENHSTIPLGFYDTNYQYPCRLYNNSGSGGIHNIAYTSESDIYVTDIVLSCVDRGVADAGFVWVGFYLPYVSENTVLEERGIPSEPSDEPSMTDLTGVITGDLVSNSTGYNANLDININSPDYNSKLDAIQSAINPAYDSSSIDDMGAGIQSGVSEENVVLDAASTGLTSLPGDLEFDESLTSGAINPLNSFFNENIIGIMIFWVGSIAFISYILFGKWV